MIFLRGKFRKCPTCKGRGYVMMRIGRGTKKDFQETMCITCHGQKYIPRKEKK